jgi:hypothetical protein
VNNPRSSPRWLREEKDQPMTQPSLLHDTPRITPWRELPNWYVTNGRAVVGPVNTNLLLRGISVGKVDRECYVAQYSWSNWREQNNIREIRSLRRWQHSQKRVPGIEPIKQALRAPRFDGSALERIAGEDSVLSRALELAMQTTKANVGIMHQPMPPHIGLVTSFAHGPGMGINLGEVVPWHDEARIVAATDRAQLGTPEQDAWARASARRLSNRINRRVNGVALVSIAFGGSRGMLELGRYDHTFRQSDIAVLEDLSRSIVVRLGQLGD